MIAIRARKVAEAAAIALLLAAGGARAQAPGVDESTGRVSYEYGFDLPAARGRFQPRLALLFRTPTTPMLAGTEWAGPCGNSNTGYGMGWSLPVPYIVWSGSPVLMAGREARPLVQTQVSPLRRAPEPRIAWPGAARPEFA